MPTYKAVLRDAKKRTRTYDKETSATELLMLHFSELQATEFYLDYEKPMPEDKRLAFEHGLNQYLEDHIPVQQIMGYVYFYGHKFKVTKQALIPRFETEELVANVLILYDEYFQGQRIDLVDVGTGSGCLAVTLAKEEENLNVSATDISEQALSLAKENADLLGVNVCFKQGDMLKPIMDQRFDILVSNPPYIPSDEEVDTIILNNEPHIALFGGKDGLKFIREIIHGSKAILKDKAIIAMEHAYDKGEAIRLLAKETYPQAKIYTLKDMQGLDRMTFIIKGF